MVSRTDPETMRLLNDDIVLCVQANPDGQEIVANWYMREKDPLKRTFDGLPKLYNKYIGHDDNRDFYMSNMPETTNMNADVHRVVSADRLQPPPDGSGGRGDLHAAVPRSVQLQSRSAGSAGHRTGGDRHAQPAGGGRQGRVGDAQRRRATPPGGTAGCAPPLLPQHDRLLTEIIGSPTPMDIRWCPKQLPQGDWPLPIAPQKWHYRQSIDYEITNNRAVLDVASRYRETFLYNLWRMGMNSIERGSRDNWTITPKRIEALEAAA
jgi:hypothetical protein